VQQVNGLYAIEGRHQRRWWTNLHKELDRMAEGESEGQLKILVWGAGIALTVIIGCLTNALMGIQDVKIAIAEMKASRFTASDGVRIYERIAEIQSGMNLMQKLGTEAGKERMQSMEDRLNKLENGGRK